MPLTVFIVDDSQPVSEMLSELVREPGRIEVVGSADSPEAAMDAIARLRPDVVVLDLQLKGGSGTDVVRSIRARQDLAGTRVLITSNHTSPQLRAGCLELGAEGFFDKVKELADLAARLRTMAEAKGH